MKLIRGTFSLLLLTCLSQTQAYDGHLLWLPRTVGEAVGITLQGDGGTALLARQELQRHWQGGAVELLVDKGSGLGEGYVITAPASAMGHTSDGQATRVVAANGTGLLYGAFALLRQQAMGLGIHDETSSPTFALRLLNHWDNLDGTIERGYAGHSIFWNTGLEREEWERRIGEYGRANASLGINGAVLNNVNASPKVLTEQYVDTVRAVADILRPWGIRVYLSVNFGSPMALGETETADPLDESVARWWQGKAREIYEAIPDFGGFLVKANSEGQPGPFDYGRTHADGANMLAAALKPYGGIVVWRSFVYGSKHKGEDRVMQAVSEFAELDGEFADNVILQSKNGPLDFQPREPYAPIFDNMSETPQMAELQITQEYLGQSRHLVYLATMWEEFFRFVSPDRLWGIAGVANVGDDANWCGHDFSQANWYAFGRLAWDPSLTAEDVAREWLAQTFTTEETFLRPMTELMMESREDCVDYMMPLGLHHIFKFDHHYGPEPDGFKAEYPLEWCPVYYHQADSLGIGFDRTSKGSGATAQYREPFRSLYDGLASCPEEYLLWFHHVPWDYRLKNNLTLWDNLRLHYNRGVSSVEAYQSLWELEKAAVVAADGDDGRWQRVARLLRVQLADAREWRDVCLGYFSKFAAGGRD